MEIHEIINNIASFTTLHFIVVALFLLTIYGVLNQSFRDEREKKSVLRLRGIQKWVSEEAKDSRMVKLINNHTTMEKFKKAGLPNWLTPIRQMSTLLSIFVVTLISFTASNVFHIYIVSSMVAYFICLICIALLPIKYFPVWFLLDLRIKSYTRKKNMEVYSLYTQIRSEFMSGVNVMNTYNLLYSFRSYFREIRPAIDTALTHWHGINGSGKAWDAFALEVGTEEAENLATVMKDVENTSPKEALSSLSRKHEEFANANKNEFNNYLSDRENIIYFVILICALSVVANPALAQYLQYKEMMANMNNFM